MRGIHLGTYTPAATSVTGLGTAVTGATWTLTNTSAGDNLAHIITIKGNAATDHSAKTAIITGTDNAGVALTETVNLPNGTATVSSTKYFLTVTSIVPSATIGADTMGLGYTAVAVTPPVVLNYKSGYFQVGIGCDITGTINVTAEETLANVMNVNIAQGAVYLADTTFASKTGNFASAITIPCHAVRFKINSVTASATVLFHVIQGM